MLPVIDPLIIAAILACFGVGLSTLIEILKGLFKITSGAWLYVISIGCTLGATAAVLAMNQMFSWLNFFLYGFVAFLELSGAYFKVVKPISNAIRGVN